MLDREASTALAVCICTLEINPSRTEGHQVHVTRGSLPYVILLRDESSHEQALEAEAGIIRSRSRSRIICSRQTIKKCANGLSKGQLQIQ